MEVACLSKSSVLDVSNATSSSQISLLDGKKIQKSILDKHSYEIQDDEYDGDKDGNVRAATKALQPLLLLQVSSTTKAKYYGDKIKLVLAGKCHLNNIVTSLKNLPARNIPFFETTNDPSDGLELPSILFVNCRQKRLPLTENSIHILPPVPCMKLNLEVLKA
ncbi:hypothetical protein G6F70_007501 [Rhizopus microsporus]|uniref:Uncharacterized protein n=1 Tax=Rhizopus microsporus TaxID=58291 RepID=A0A1X0S6Z4_RHIZD|nr:hypothetical protein G6F71_007470 [Rhizopus microsporus]KAG1196370.1 hypothetical protein G6F70_007501 [Rhizopus microsporus]KAG1212000.1 hypothetical protein G6F69_004105 [Rhizopus microsporus]KAG1233908.1 hypothetical protein G6F67_003941 [Rhizopus microsporus]KAG1266031.1 hypothetical protein G6F68_003077 [Rhizopus microsporus]